MPYYPILIDLTGKRVVVVGGGAVAQRKIETLLEYGAIVDVISRDLTPLLSKYEEEGKIRLLDLEFGEKALDGAFMVIAATDDPGLNHEVSKHARAKGLLINAVDQPNDCNFIVPAILRRGELTIAVSTSGKSPALAKKVREKLEQSFGSEYESFLNLMGWLRQEILSRGFSQDKNSRLFHELVDSPLLYTIGQKDWKKAAAIINDILQTRYSEGDIMKFAGGHND
ncbi:MAG: bifunctional precorrin-2 dehydrogenase/sirohydrochlorin ferrochelatase [Pseudomonadota bacterium]